MLCAIFIPADDLEEEEWFRGGCIRMACCCWWNWAGGGISMSGWEQSTGPSEGCRLTVSAPFVCLSSARGGSRLTTDEAFSRPSSSKIMTLNREFPLYLNNIILSRISRLNFCTQAPPSRCKHKLLFLVLDNLNFVLTFILCFKFNLSWDLSLETLNKFLLDDLRKHVSRDYIVWRNSL